MSLFRSVLFFYICRCGEVGPPWASISCLRYLWWWTTPGCTCGWAVFLVLVCRTFNGAIVWAQGRAKKKKKKIYIFIYIYISPPRFEVVLGIKENGHYGETLKSFVSYIYHGLRSTEGLVETFLNDFGVRISKSTIHSIIVKGALDLRGDYNSILKTALLNSAYIQVDDTKEIHNNKAGYFTQIANEAFTWFAANDSKR